MQKQIVFDSIEEMPEIFKCYICMDICVQPTLIYNKQLMRWCEYHRFEQQVAFSCDRSNYNMLSCKCKFCGQIKNAFKIKKHQIKCEDIYTRNIKLSSQVRLYQNFSYQKCNDCKDIPFSPQTCIACQNIICFICKVKHSCQSSFTEVDQSIIKPIILICSINKCNTLLDINSGLNHFKKCPLKFRVCPKYQQCRWTGKNRDYDYHKKYCQKGIYQVQNQIVEAEIEVHELQCKYSELKFQQNRVEKRIDLQLANLNLVDQMLE